MLDVLQQSITCASLLLEIQTLPYLHIHAHGFYGHFTAAPSWLAPPSQTSSLYLKLDLSSAFEGGPLMNVTGSTAVSTCTAAFSPDVHN